MASRRLTALLCLALLLSPTLVLAQEGSVTETTEILAGQSPVEEVEAGQLLQLRSVVDLPERTNTSWRAFLNGTVANTSIDGVQAQAGQADSSMELIAAFNVPSDAEPGPLSVTYELTVQSLNQTPAQPPSNDTSENGTSGNETSGNETAPPPEEARWQTEEVFTSTVTLTVPAPPTPPEGPPVGLITAVLVGLLVVGGGVVAYLKWPRQYKHESGPRSKALQDLDRPKEAGGGGGAGQAGAAAGAMRQGSEVHPQLKILEARARDLRRLIDLAKERHERGDLTEHQFENIRQKKEAELEEIEAEMETYRSGGS